MCPAHSTTWTIRQYTTEVFPTFNLSDNSFYYQLNLCNNPMTVAEHYSHVDLQKYKTKINFRRKHQESKKIIIKPNGNRPAWENWNIPRNINNSFNTYILPF